MRLKAWLASTDRDGHDAGMMRSCCIRPDDHPSVPSDDRSQDIPQLDCCVPVAGVTCLTMLCAGAEGLTSLNVSYIPTKTAVAMTPDKVGKRPLKMRELHIDAYTQHDAPRHCEPRHEAHLEYTEVGSLHPALAEEGGEEDHRAGMSHEGSRADPRMPLRCLE